MKDSGGGSIVNIGSVAADVGTPGGSAYGSSKGGVCSLTKLAAVMRARKGYHVRVNTVHPCYIRTPLTEASASARVGKENALQSLRDLHPFQMPWRTRRRGLRRVVSGVGRIRLVNAADLVLDGGLLSTCAACATLAACRAASALTP